MAAQKLSAPVQELTFNIRTGSYATFISSLRQALAGNNPEKVRDRPVLARQTGETAQPPRWIYVVLKGDGSVAPKVAIRTDNAYIVGFANRPNGSTEDVWYQLSPRNSTQLFKGAKMLGFNGHYSTLVGGHGVQDLPTMEFGVERTLEAANVLWNYKQDKLSDGIGAGDPQKNLKRKLALLAVILCEATRLKPVDGVINKGWQQRASITSKEVNYIRDWSDISTALLAWKADLYKNDEKHFSKFAGIGIKNGTDAIAVAQLLLNKPPKKGLLAWLSTCWGCWSCGDAEGVEETLQLPSGAGKAMPGNKSSSIVNPVY